jgi:hypothetical protein
MDERLPHFLLLFSMSHIGKDFEFFFTLVHFNFINVYFPQIPLTVIEVVSLVALANPWLTLPIIVILVAVLKLLHFLKTAQNIKRLEATSIRVTH